MNDRFKFRVYKKTEKRMIYDVTWLNPLLLDETINKEEAQKHILMQGTGLKDKNNSLIYEGDVVEVEEVNAKIEWDNNLARFVISCKDENWQADFDNYYGYELEIIGNIYENPELLTEDKTNGENIK